MWTYIAVGRQSLIDSLYNKENTDILVNALELIVSRARNPLTVHDPSAAVLQQTRNMLANSLSKVLASYHSRPKDCSRRPAIDLWTKLGLASSDICDRITHTFCKSLHKDDTYRVGIY